MLKYLKILSIDIALGAAVGTWFFSRIIDKEIPFLVFVVVALVVWSIYTIDHLLDSRTTNNINDPERYSYHKDNHVIFYIVILTLTTALLLTIFFLPTEIIKYGLYLAVLVVIYFLFQVFLKPVFAGLKELFAAIIYTAGVILPSLYYVDEFNLFYLIILLQFFSLVFANLLICSLWDLEWDKFHRQNSMAMAYGKKFIIVIAITLLIIGLLSSLTGIIIYNAYYEKIELVILFMNLILLIAYLAGTNFGEHTRRLLIDSIFFIPLILPVL